MDTEVTLSATATPLTVIPLLFLEEIFPHSLALVDSRSGKA